MKTRSGPVAIGIVVGLMLQATSAVGGSCNSERYEVTGRVVDASGRPAANARVHVLIDRVSKAKSLEHGMRARPFAADADGRYTASIVCGDQPDPCAKRPKHLTVAVSTKQQGLKLKTFSLKELDPVTQAGACRVEVPDIAFSP